VINSDPDAFEIYFSDEIVMQMGRNGLVTIRRDGRARWSRANAGRSDISLRLEGETLALGGRQLHLDATGTLQIDGPAIGGTPRQSAHRVVAARHALDAGL
jgi:hypothetical protein